MTDHDSLMPNIMRRAFRVDAKLLDCLLLIRSVSPASADFPRTCRRAGSEAGCRGETPWDTIADEARRADGHVVPAIKYALGQIKRDRPLAQELADGLDDVTADERTLRDLIDLLSAVPADSDILPAVYAYNLLREPRKAVPGYGDFYTPVQIVQGMAALLDIESGGSVYDPCCGSGAMLCGAALSHKDKGLSLYGQTLDQSAYTICRMNLALHGLSADLGERPANTLLEDLHLGERFDYVLTNPPFNLSDWRDEGAERRDIRWQYGLPPRKNANFAWLQHIIGHLAADGRAVTLMPNSTLTTQNHAESEIREGILRDGWIEAIIALPPGLFYGTKIPCCAWVIGKSTRDTVLFIDARQLDLREPRDRGLISELLRRYRKDKPLAESDWYAAASRKEIAKRRCILSPNLYIRPKELSLPPLAQISAEFSELLDALCARLTEPRIRDELRQWKTREAPTSWKEAYLTDLYDVFGGVSAKKEAFGHGTPMADVKTVIRHRFLPDALPASVEVPERLVKKYGIKRGDVLLNRASETLDELACCSVAAKDHAAVYGAYLKRLRPVGDGAVDPLYMAGYFRSAIYRHEVERIAFDRTTRANVNLYQLSMIRLYYPDADQQRAIGDTLLQATRLGSEGADEGWNALLDRFVKVFIEKYITYPIFFYRKERDRQ